MRNFLEEESRKLLLKFLEHEQEAKFLAHIIVSVGLLYEPRAVPLLLRLKNHPNIDIRYAISHALNGYDEAPAINALIELSQDMAHDVRAGAMFSLGQVTNLDTPSIRQALWKGIDDKHEETRYEAYVGLVLRRDWNVIGRIKSEVDRGERWEDTELLIDFYYRLSLWNDETPDPRLLEVIKHYKRKYYNWNLT